MELTELSLAPTLLVNVESNMNNLYSESEIKPSKKRKMFPSSDHDDLLGPPRPLQASVDLHVKNPLPLDWEQCLDLESGRKYYLNRKTLRKSWQWPKDQVVDLELNMSSSNCITTQTDHHDQTKSFKQSNYILDQDSNNTGYDQDHNNHSSTTNMVALACLNCHLLVILSKTCPACPNCKYVHSLPTLQTSHLPHHHKVSPAKSLNTLSLLN